MAKGIYVASAEPESHKSIVVLGMMEFLCSQAQKVGFFMPVVHGNPNSSPIKLISTRYKLEKSIESMYGVTHEVAHDLIASNSYEELLKRIMEKYRALEKSYDVVLCAGTDFRGVSTPLEFDFNIDVSKNLGCMFMPVIRGSNRSISEISEALSSIVDGLEKRHAQLLAIVVNQVSPAFIVDARIALSRVSSNRVPIYAIADSTILSKPSICDIAEALGAKFLNGTEQCSLREVTQYKVGAMELPSLLGHLKDGTLVITSGDRADILLGCLAADSASTYPRMSGILLTGGHKPAPSVQLLIDGFSNASFPILSVQEDTFSTAIKVSKVEGTLNFDNIRKIETALGLFEEGVKISELKNIIEVSHSSRVTPLMFEYGLIQAAKTDKQRIVLPEGEEPRILQACELLLLRQACEIILLGNPVRIKQKMSELGLKLDAIQIIDPTTSELRQEYADTYYELRKHKGITPEIAFETISDASYFGTMMVYKGHADGMVSGSVNTTQHTIRPALEFIKTRPGVSIVSSIFFMCLEQNVLVFGDCAVNPNPDEKQLAEIAVSAAETSIAFGIEPRVAMLSYSTGDSGSGKEVEKVREATKIAKTLRPDLMIEGPIQFDAAFDPEVAKIKLKNSKVAGKATVFIFPDLNTGNNTYKAVQRSANSVAIGPVLQGLNKPVNDLSRGCTVPDILNTVIITAIQAQAMKRNAKENS